jgi:hypothetical protein
MQVDITRLPNHERMYVVVTASGTRYGVRDFELKRWLLYLGVDDSTIAAVLDIDPNETMAVQVAKAA